MFELCLFDLDQTLLDTHDLEDVRLEGIGKLWNDNDYTRELRVRYLAGKRHFYSEQFLLKVFWS